MKHYTNKKTLKVYGYDNDEVAKQYNDDYRNLVLMSDELFQEYRKQPPGGKWTLEGWVIDEEEARKINRERLIFETKRLLADKKTAQEDLEVGEALEDQRVIDDANGRIAKAEKRISEIKIELASMQ